MTPDRTTWIVTADGHSARIFEQRAAGGRLHELGERALSISGSDFGGEHHARATVHARAGHARHGAGDRDISAEAESRFLSRVGAELEQAAKSGAFEALALIAPARALGDLKAALGAHARERLVAASDRRLVDLSADELAARLDLELKPAARS